ncbi:melibiase family protein [Nannochloropsis gaditana]|uniref:Alpha-galactosidase n=3 Tax=Nannochloropsis gaditana TaxID=72520 RepID=W7TJL7_9STRA|nr:melibiase family protein [Nannochloropsis gaditana]
MVRRKLSGPTGVLLSVIATIPSLLLFTSTVTTNALPNGLGLTPAMGFNTWNRFHCDIDEAMVKETARLLIDTGLRDLGYVFVNLDDCWMARNRSAEGGLVEDPVKFPSGIKGLGDYLHALGFKFGIYSSAGSATCEGFPASLGMEGRDAETWSEWGVDYLKYDNCHTDGTSPQERYPPMRDALNATGRPVLYSMCEWGLDNPGAWAPAVSNLWRTTPDIRDEWSSVMEIVEINGRRWRYAGPGGFNDPDMLEVGNGGMGLEEYRAHMSLWCVMKAPLLIGCDLRGATMDVLALLGNEEVIAVNQDPLGVQARRVWSSGSGGGRGVGKGGSPGSPFPAIVVPCALAPEKGEDAVWWILEPAGLAEVAEGGGGARGPSDSGGGAELVSVRSVGSGGGKGTVQYCLAVKEGLGGHGRVEGEEITRVMRLRWEGDSMEEGVRKKEASVTGGRQDVAQEDDADAGMPLSSVGLRVTLAPCLGPAPFSLFERTGKEQLWRRKGSLLMPESAPHLCLGVIRSNQDPLRTGLAVELAPCNASLPRQQWETEAGPGSLRAEGMGTPGAEESKAAWFGGEEPLRSSSVWAPPVGGLGSSSPQLLVNAFQHQCLAPETDAPAGAQEIWIGPLSGGAFVLLLFNRSTVSARISALWRDLGLGLEEGSYEARDLWARRTLPPASVADGIRDWEVPGHGAAMFKLSPKPAL